MSRLLRILRGAAFAVLITAGTCLPPTATAQDTATEEKASEVTATEDTAAKDTAVKDTKSADDKAFRAVAPILERRCLSCHNDEQRKGDFSLQSAKAAFADGYVTPGRPRESHLLEVVTAVDGRARMPKGSDPLKAEELALLRRWIADGAHWPTGVRLREPRVTNFDWWSYRPVARPAVPEVDDAWIRTPVDAFVLRRLKAAGISPSAEADRRTLIRRVTYDLTGLPPTPQVVAAFVADTRPRAYERLVDRLLASKAYGERWARHWLDVVKYADTCGYDKDKLRPHAWPYRDYVIRSLNEDKPYGRFVREQIAGDVLYPGEPDGILGLGFIAAGPWDFIGHVEVPESKLDGRVARNLDRDDMVSNAINTFCSLTVQCARCHNHKFDPITQEHYYGLQSIFAAVDRANRPYDQSHEVVAERRRLLAERKRLEGERTKLEGSIAEAGGRALKTLDERIASLRGRQAVRKTPAFGYHSTIVKSPDVAKWVAVDLGRPRSIERIVLHPCHDEYAGIGAGFGFPVRFRVEVSGDGRNWRTVSDQTRRDVPNPGLDPFVVATNAKDVRHVRVTATRLVERKGDYILALAELAVYEAAPAAQAPNAPDSKPAEPVNVARGATVRSLDSIQAPVRWARSNLTDGEWARTADPNAGRELAAAIAERTALLAEIETPERIAERKRLQAAITAAQKKLDALPAASLVYAAATSFQPQGNFKPTGGRPRDVRVLHRGDLRSPGEPAPPALLPFAAADDWRLDATLDESARRAALARWLTRPEHPLVWRSIVNRVWQYHFGTGLVATPNDFGRMGARPSHPELLDWLAVEFRDGGQSLKTLHRLLVTSSVYRQSSRRDEAKARVDGGNRLLWRMPRRRLAAEELRDSILAVSGALDPKMGGPGFYLFKLEKTAHSPHYEYHAFDPADPASHRRSIYRFIVRSQPDPWMTTLDCADSSQSTPRRNETLTSLQALSLLNNRFNLVMAERFAARLRREAESPEEQVDRAVALIAQRRPGPDERALLVAHARKHGLENVCRLLFNLNEFVYLD